MDNTLNYYNKFANEFTHGTFSVDFSEIQQRFMDKLMSGAYILDFGCGSGRDTKSFIECGFRVDAADGSEEMCKFASANTGIDVKHMLFQELCEVDRYDGIWACASILHLPKGELKQVLLKMSKALKNDGVIYTSFKYGDYEGERNGRYFSDFTIESFMDFCDDIEDLIIEEYWITTDVRPGRGDEKWMNLILRKKDIH